MSNLKYRRSLLATTMISGAIMAAAAAPAFAQETAPAEDQATVEDVVVTGSRLARQDFAAISPVTTVGSEQLELTATVSVESLLNELPQVIPGNNRSSNNSGGEEFATIDLRGLGPSRTLVLVNGERVPPSSTTGVVDLNTIPATLISRIEVVTGGASAVYGSDAMSGVVNFILKDNYEGAEISSTYGESFDGYAREFEVNGIVGGNFADGRGNITAYASYYNRERVSQGDLDYSRVSGALVITPDGGLAIADSTQEWIDNLAAGGAGGATGGSGTTAWGTITNNGANPFNVGVLNATNPNFASYDHDCNPATPNVSYGFSTTAATRNLSFNPDGSLRPIQTSGACAVPIRANGSDYYNFAPDNYLITPAERINLATIGHYDITDSIRFDFRLNYTNSWQQVSLAPTPATGLTVTLTPAMQSLISTNHPDLWAALQSRPNPLASFTMSRRTNEVGPRLGDFENNALAMVGTLAGDFGDFVPSWDWSITTSYGVNNATSVGANSVNATALRQGLAGCQRPDGTPMGITALPGCVPLDIFGAGTLTADMVNFITVPTFATTEIEQKRISGFVRGNLFTLPAGPVAAVFGAEYREDSADFRVDNEQRSGNIFGFNAIQNQEGSIEVTEFYTEVAVPILADLPFVNYLGVEGGYRTSDYNTVGTLDTYKIGAEYAPTDWLRFRAVYNEAARAPSVFESFQNGDQGFASVTDPCNANNPNGNAALTAFCSAQAGGFDYTGFQQANSQAEVFSFGNPNLTPESAETFTVGVVLQPGPTSFGNFRATIDYFDIQIADAISGLGAGFFLSSCYDPDAPGADADACARIVRDPVTGEIDRINTTVANQDEYATKGFDVQLDWSLNMDDFGLPGVLRVNNLYSYTDEISINGSNFVGTNNSGIGGGNPDWKNVLSAYYTLADWTVFGRWSYVPSMQDGNNSNNFNDGSPIMLPEASYVDASVRWNVTDSIDLTAFIGNLLDEDTPQISAGYYTQANTDVQVYRTLGRTFAITARARF